MLVTFLKKDSIATKRSHGIYARRDAPPLCRRVHQQSEAFCQDLRCQLGNGRMVQLPPGREMPHVCSVVVLHGRVTLTSATPIAVSANPESTRQQAGLEGDEVQRTYWCSSVPQAPLQFSAGGWHMHTSSSRTFTPGSH